MFVLTSVSLFQCKPLHNPRCERRDAMQNIQDGGAKGCQRGCQEVWLVILKIASRDRMIAVESSYDCCQKFVWLLSNTKTTAKLLDEYAPGGGGKGLVYGKQRQLPAVRETRWCVSVTTGSCTGYDDMLKRSLPGVCQISGIPASRHSCLMLSGQMLACISPMCALWSITMQRRLCPIPPPMERGSLPSSSWRWK